MENTTKFKKEFLLKRSPSDERTFGNCPFVFSIGLMVLQLLSHYYRVFNRESSCDYDCKRSVRTILDGTNQTSTFHKCYAMVAVMFMRVYWAFVGNRFANWRQFVPFDKKRKRKNVARNQVWYLFIQRKEYKFTNIPIGHNAVAAAFIW